MCKVNRSKPDISFKLTPRSFEIERVEIMRLGASLIQNIELSIAYLLESILVNSTSKKLFEVIIVMVFEIVFNITLVG